MSTSRRHDDGSKPVDPVRYDGDYFERGPVLGISGYMNYGWMPELTLRMAHKLILSLPIAPGEKILDYGCAKGFLVKAMRILDVEAYGVDVSAYAVQHADGDVRDYCKVVEHSGDAAIFEREYDWLIAKDVLEHLTEKEVSTLLTCARGRARRLFAAIPLANDDTSGHYIIPDYDRDVTHTLAKSLGWWTRLFEAHGWKVDTAAHTFPGCKENWTSRWDDGNGFFVASSK